MPVSPSGSFKGWSFAKWYELNRGSIRTIIATLTGVLSTWASATTLPTWGTVAVGIVVGPGCKIVLDTLDYRWSNVGYDEPER